MPDISSIDGTRSQLTEDQHHRTFHLYSDHNYLLETLTSSCDLIYRVKLFVQLDLS